MFIKMTSLFKKTVLLALAAALALAALPMTSASAAGLGETPEPPADQAQVSDERLEQVWARLQQAYERQGQALERAGEMTTRIQSLIDKMTENGKDTAALQAALDAFEQGLAEAQPVYASAGSIISAHAGFDAEGKVTDREQAIATLKDLGGKVKELRQLIGEPGKALREAVKAFRQAHRPADDAATPSGTNIWQDR
ncbi:MAG: hypothetical protein ACOYYJ_06060 [Chloroflexota bacterium]